MKKTTLTFTALPHRAIDDPDAGRKLQLSVFIAPRLWTTDPDEEKQILHLTDFPLFEDWPAQVGALTFGVTFSGGPTLPATQGSAGELDSDIWQALFPLTLPVKPFRFDNLANTPIQTIDTAFLADWLQKVYRRVGTNPAYGAGADKPPVEVMQKDPDLIEIARPSQPEPPYVPPPRRRVPVHYKAKEDTGCPWGCLSLLFDVLNDITSALGLGKPFKLPGQSPAHIPVQPKTSPQPALATPPAGQAPAAGDEPQGTSTAKAKFDEVNTFLQPLDDIQVIPPRLTEAELAELLDFHDGVALVADYPSLLRALGLVVDLEVDWPAGLPDSGMVAVEVSAPGGAHGYCLRTHYTLSGGRFLPAPRPVLSGETETLDGLLRLSDESRFRIVQADVVGASVKMQNAATTTIAWRNPHLRPANPPTEATLPSLRSAGLAVVQTDLAAQLAATYERAVGLNNGLAMDDGSPQVSVLLGPTEPAPVQPAPIDELWAEDVIRGYRMDVRDLDSLSKKWRSLHQRTGLCHFIQPQPAIDFSVKDEGYVQLAITEPTVSGSQPVQRIHDVVATWTGWSLSAVRPGKSLVESDVPGETVQDVSNTPESAKTAFKMLANFTPVDGTLPKLRFGHRYQVRVRTVDLAGNSAFGPGDAKGPGDDEFQQAHPDDSEAQPYCRFEPVPSPAVVLRASPIPGESVERLVVRSAAQASDPYQVKRAATERHIVPPKSSQLLAEHHGKFDDAQGQLEADLGTYNRAAMESGTLTQGWSPASGELEVLPGTKFLDEGDANKDPTFWQGKTVFPLAYLPDEFARQAVLRNLPGLSPGAVHKTSFSGDWPDRLPFRLRLVGIPAGEDPAPPHWPLDPAKPAARVLTVELAAGESRVVRLSSGVDKNDLSQLGVWGWETEPPTPNFDTVRDHTLAGRNWLLMPYRELVLVHATQKPLSNPVLTIDQEDVTKAEGDTAVTLTGSAAVDGKTTGKVDLLALWTDPDDDLSQALPGERKSRAACGEFNVTSPQAASVSIQATHNLGDTKYHLVTYVARGATRFREYLPPELLDPETPGNKDAGGVTMDLITTPIMAEISEGAPTGATVKVLNSARPLAPAVDYVMPSLGRVQTTVSGTTITRTRRGSGLRVYLQRPWFSSGAGEMLGVVFKAQSFASPGAWRPYVTEWANDPLWDAPAADPAPSLANFVGHTAHAQVLLEEVGEPVTVVGYPVEYDPDRGLWFADVEFSAGELGTYTPMVRLALARFQPESVHGLGIDDTRISRVVRIDFVQPLPDRTLTIQKSQSGSPPSLQLTVTLTGRAPTPGEGQSRPVQAWIEERAEPDQGELGWVRLEGENFQPAIIADAAALWKGTFTLGLLPPNIDYRLVIQEIEPVGPPSFSGLPEEGGESYVPLGRTVYADAWEF